MRLPNASKAIVEGKKIVDYLLNPAHPDNGGKAQFFDKLKFHRKEWKTLAEALRTLGRRDRGDPIHEIAARRQIRDYWPDRIARREGAAGADDLDYRQRG